MNYLTNLVMFSAFCLSWAIQSVSQNAWAGDLTGGFESRKFNEIESVEVTVTGPAAEAFFKMARYHTTSSKENPPLDQESSDGGPGYSCIAHPALAPVSASAPVLGPAPGGKLSYTCKFFAIGGGELQATPKSNLPDDPQGL